MKKSTFISIALIAMIALNIVLFVLFLTAPERHDKDRAKRIVIRELNLDNKQISRYETLIAGHRKAIRAADEKMRAAKSRLYSTLGEETDSATLRKLIDRTADVQKEIEQVHYRHFQDIRNLLRKDQLPLFEKLKAQLNRIFAPPHPPK